MQTVGKGSQFFLNYVQRAERSQYKKNVLTSNMQRIRKSFLSRGVFNKTFPRLSIMISFQK